MMIISAYRRDFVLLQTGMIFAAGFCLGDFVQKAETDLSRYSMFGRKGAHTGRDSRGPLYGVLRYLKVHSIQHDTLYSL